MTIVWVDTDPTGCLQINHAAVAGYEEAAQTLLDNAVYPHRCILFEGDPIFGPEIHTPVSERFHALYRQQQEECRRREYERLKAIYEPEEE